MGPIIPTRARICLCQTLQCGVSGVTRSSYNDRRSRRLPAFSGPPLHSPWGEFRPQPSAKAPDTTLLAASASAPHRASRQRCAGEEMKYRFTLVRLFVLIAFISVGLAGAAHAQVGST